MNIFVTGATGFLGAAYIKKMSGCGNIGKIYCTYRTSPAINNDKIVWIRADINDISSLSLDSTIDAAVHFAAYLKRESKKDFEAVNIKGTESVISFCGNNNIKKIIHCSTVNVKLQKKGGYARSKQKAEELIINSGIDYIIARPALIYGPGDAGLNKMVTSAKKLGLIPVFGSGKYLQQPVYIDELTDYFKELTFCKLQNVILELGGIEQLSYTDMIKHIGEALGRKVSAFKLPAPLILAALAVIESMNIPFPLRREQIYQNNEDLVCENTLNPDDLGFEVKQSSFLENLRKYI